MKWEKECVLDVIITATDIAKNQRQLKSAKKNFNYSWLGRK